MGKKPLDLKQLRQFIEVAGSDSFKSLVDIFLEQIPQNIDDLKKAIAAGDFQQAQRFAHNGKSSSLTLGATTLGDHFKNIEKSAFHGQLKDAQAEIQLIKAEFIQLKAQLKKIRPEDLVGRE